MLLLVESNKQLQYLKHGGVESIRVHKCALGATVNLGNLLIAKPFEKVTFFDVKKIAKCHGSIHNFLTFVLLIIPLVGMFFFLYLFFFFLLASYVLFYCSVLTLITSKMMKKFYITRDLSDGISEFLYFHSVIVLKIRTEVLCESAASVLKGHTVGRKILRPPSTAIFFLSFLLYGKQRSELLLVISCSTLCRCIYAIHFSFVFLSIFIFLKNEKIHMNFS